MADAAVAALVKDVLGRLTFELIKEYGLLRGLEDDISSLKEDFEQIQAVLQDAEDKRSKHSAVALWLKRLRSASLEAENVLDEISTQALLQRLHTRRVKYKVRAFFSSNHNKYMARVRIAHKVKDVRRKLNDINSRGTLLNLTRSALGSVDEDVAGEMPADRETSSRVLDSSVILGRNEEMEMVIRKICDKDVGTYENGEIRVYGIWGMGGLGKTTLAQLVYNHERVNQYFDLKCWVYVSQNFQVQEIMKKIIESIDKSGCTLTQLETVQESVQSKLRGKKFLILLDDVWVEQSEKAKWDQLSATLSCGAEGSIVVLTTRSESTSQMFSKVPKLQHKLECLSKKDSWSLFTKLAFAQGRKGGDISELEPIGREIVKKCKGLPLAVKTMGSLMWSKSSTSDWKCVKDSNIWELEETNIVPVSLKLSYDNLFPHLKRCFAYSCLFPKGYKMKKDGVIQLWVFNGFIPPRVGKDLYMLGEEIFYCLVWRSFFIVKATKWGDRYVMHDLMHDMARHVMGDDCLVIEPGKEVIIPNGVLHLSSSCPDFHFSPQDLEKLTSLRSVFMFGEKYKCNFSQIFSHVHVRVLYLHGVDLDALPKSIYKLQHLKYLNLSQSHIEVLCESIMYLQNLQMLLLNSCSRLCKLPEGLRYMRNLQRLELGYHCLPHLPHGIKELTSLRTLSRFPLDNMSGAKIEELGNLNLLEGELGIDGLKNVGGLSEAKSANLKCKTNMSSLVLSWSNINTRENRGEMFAHDEEEVLEGLEPNFSLKELTIQDYPGKSISPSWMTNLNNLVKIMFFNCKKCEHIPALGRLPNLRVIILRDMNSLKYFHDEGTNMFISLQKLKIYNCPNLISLPTNTQKLEVLSLKGCEKLEYPSDEIFKDMKKLKLYRRGDL